MKAYLKNYRQSPRKVRLVADSIRGESVEKAMAFLGFLNNKSATAVKKLLQSALANAKSIGVDTGDMIIKEVMVDQGITMKRYRPMSRGRANPYRKRTSNIKLFIGKKVDILGKVNDTK